MATLIESITDGIKVPKEVSDLAGAAVADLLIKDFPQQSLVDDCETAPKIANGSVADLEAGASGQEKPPASVDGLPKKLLILDVNGFLIDTCFKYDKARPKNREPDGAVNNFIIYARPHCDEFVKFCLDNFIVGVWSSARRHNVEGLTRYIFKESASQLAFIWGQDQCTDTGLRHPENHSKPIFLKELKKVWQTPPFKGVYGPSNTLLIDDSAYKALRNPPYTGIFPQTYQAGEGSQEHYLALDGPIRSFLQGVHLAPDVRVYVKAHPFGQAAISVGADHSIEISGAIDEKVREETRKSYEDFVARKKAGQSTSSPEKGNKEKQRGRVEEQLEKAVHKAFPGGSIGANKFGVPFPGWPSAEEGRFAFAQHTRGTSNGWDAAERGWSDDEGKPGMNGRDRVATNGRERSRSPVGVRNGFSSRQQTEGWGPDTDPGSFYRRPVSQSEATGWSRQSAGWESEADERGRPHWPANGWSSKPNGWTQEANGWSREATGWSNVETGWQREERLDVGQGTNGHLDFRQERPHTERRPRRQWGQERHWNQKTGGAEQPFSREAPNFSGRFREHLHVDGEGPAFFDARLQNGAAVFSGRSNGPPGRPWGGFAEPWQAPPQSADGGFEHRPHFPYASSGGHYRGPAFVDGAPFGRGPLPHFRDYRQVTDPEFRRWTGEQYPPGLRRERWNQS